MVHNYVRKTQRGLQYSKEDLELAVDAVKSGRMSYVDAASRFNIPKPTLVDHVKGRRGVKSKSHGRSTTLSPELENKLANLLKIMEKYGYGLTKTNVQQLVCAYLKENRLSNPFKENRPGQDWWRGFKHRHNLSIKKPQAVELSRKKAQDPFVINKYLEKSTEDMDLGGKPHNIWNLDESSFSFDPSKTRIVGARGVAATRTVSGPGRENMSVLLACSAAGDKCPPLFIFKGKNLWDKWIPTKDEEGFPGSVFAASQNGWMESKIFLNFFENTFLKIAKPSPENPVLLIYDGHSTHIGLRLAEMAVQNNVEILLLPPHSSHILQPLDLAVFKSLKSKWDEYLCRHLRNTGCEKISKKKMVSQIGRLWNGFEVNIIRNGFKKAGIYPLNRGIISKEQYHPQAWKRWTDSQLLSKTTDEQMGNENGTMEEPVEDTRPQLSETINNNQNPNIMSVKETSFEMLLLSKISSGKEKSETSRKRTRVSLGSTLITSNDCIKILKDKEATERKKKTEKEKKETEKKLKNSRQIKNSGPKNQKKKKKIIDYSSSESEELGEESDFLAEMEEDEEEKENWPDLPSQDADFLLGCLEPGESVSVDLPVVFGNLPLNAAEVIYTQDEIENKETEKDTTEDKTTQFNNQLVKKPGDLVLVQYKYSKTKNIKVFLGVIQEINESSQEYLVKYMRSIDTLKKTFKSHETDKDNVPFNEVMETEIPNYLVDNRGRYIFDSAIDEVQD